MSFPRYQRYKDSGVEWLGEVPEHWQVRNFRHSARIKNGNDFKHIEVEDGGYPVVGSGGPFARVSQFMYDRPSVLLGRKGTIDKPLYMDCPFWAVDTMYYTEIASDSIPKYVFYYSKCIPFDLFTYGSALPSMTQTTLHALDMPLPNLQDQAQIVLFLDDETAKIDALIEEQRRLIELLKEKRQAVISQAVTKGLNPDAPMKDCGVDWIGLIPQHWEVSKLGQTANIVRGGSPRPAGDSRFFNGDFMPWITVGEVTKDDSMYLVATESMLTEVGAEQSRTIDSGTLVLTNSGATLGVPKILGITGCANDGILAFLDLKTNANKKYLYFVLGSLTSELRERMKQGSGQPNLNTGIVSALQVPLPPVVEQLAIVAELERMQDEFGALMAQAETSVTLLQERRSALISAAVTGKIDEAWQALAKGHGLAADTRLLDQLRQNLDTRGTLDVLRNGIELFPVKSKIALAQFRPASGINAAIMTRYAANRLRVVRQVRYSEGNENCLDLVFLLNGLPVATVELKSDFTQSVKDAVDQYRFDRHPQPKGQKAEPLLSFPGGALVHFAVSNSEAQMTTRLAGPATRFLPFNKGDHGGAGNPPSPSGHRTSYLWEEVWERESFLDILGRYLVTEKDDKKKLTRYLFPRYHQLDATRKLLNAVKAQGAGGKYLIQHSAGSGKTNSIAWTAHFFADLHDAENKKVFDSVIVVSDRNVIDQQLQDAIFDFQRTTGVVTSIKGVTGSKSKELAEALSGDKKIVVCTIQTFPFALEKVRELAASEGKRFVVIADEAHSSQTGEAAAKLKQVLSAEEWQEIEDGGEVGFDDLLRAQMTARTADTGITYVAFTATPKAKTLELFGRRPEPDQPAGPTNVPEAFHVYSMRQAIEEGFILDVLENYTTYKLAFRLAHDGKEYDETEVERSTAMKGIMRWVRLHPYNISQKVQVVVEHYLENVQPLLEGHAKAMVVVGSRLEAVRWQLAMQKYIQSRGYRLSALVAFSGEVNDKASGEDPFTENSQVLNPNLRGRDIREAFKTDEYQILLVANKFQTGFDQPLLCGMYVDKRLGGIQAVQTLSRLNRAYSGTFGTKDTTFVLDFVNEAEEVLEAFRTYYTTATLEDVTDPNLVYNLRAKLDAAGHYDEFEVDRVATVELNPQSKQGDLVRALEPVADRLVRQFKAAHERWKVAKAESDESAVEDAHTEMETLMLFKRDMGSFGHAYTFLSQIFDYGNTGLEKRAIFYKRLTPLLEFGRERDGVDLSQVVLTHHILRDRGNRALPLGEGDSPTLKPLIDAGSGSVQEKEKARLGEIIAKVNDLFGADTTEGDKLVYVNDVLKGKLMESDTLRQQAVSNSKEQFANSPDLNHELINAIMDASSALSSLSKQALESEHIRSGLKEVLLGPAQLYEALRARDSSAYPSE